MVENTLVVAKEQLTDGMIETGARLIEKLDELGLPVSAALWFYVAEINEWRLMIGSPGGSTAGSRELYRHVQDARKALGPDGERIPFTSISVVDSNPDLVKILKAGLRTGPGVSRIRFAKNVVNGHYIDDALIYRNTA